MNKNILELSLPQYAKIYNELRNEIKDYILQPGTAMPSESALMNRFSVSKQTIRHAIQLLVNEGLVVKKQGKPTYINPLISDAKEVLHIGCLNPPSILLTEYTYYFAKVVNELTHGQVQIEVHHSSEYGNGSEHIAKVKHGKLDMFCAAIDWLAELDHIWALTTYPFLYDNIEHLKKFVKSSFASSIKNKLIEEHGVKILSDNWYRPSRLLISKFPFLNSEQIKNLKIGIPSIPLYNEIWKAIGANPITINFSERKEAFINNEINITDVNWDIILSEGLQNVAKYAILSNHLFSRAALICNNQKFKSLRKDLQNALINAAEIAGKEYSKKIFSTFELHKKILLSYGVVFIEFDCSVWRNIAQNEVLKYYSTSSDEYLVYNQIKLLNKKN